MNFTNKCKCSASWHNIKVKRFSKKIFRSMTILFLKEMKFRAIENQEYIIRHYTQTS